MIPFAAVRSSLAIAGFAAGLLLLDAAPTVAQDKPQDISVICVMQADGTGWKELTTIEGHEFLGSPAVSPDGTWVAMDGWPAGASGSSAEIILLQMDAESPAVKILGPGAMPSWSHDSGWLTFARYQPQSGAWVRELDSDFEELIEPGGWGPQWSPDGSQIAWTSGRNISVFDLATREERSLFEPGTERHQRVYWNMKWSPDGKQIVFAGVRADGQMEVAIADVATGEVSVQSEVDKLNYGFAWHPDGRRILFPMRDVKRENRMQLFEIDPETDAPPKHLVGQDESRRSMACCWTPDGKQLLVISRP